MVLRALPARLNMHHPYHPFKYTLLPTGSAHLMNIIIAWFIKFAHVPWTSKDKFIKSYPHLNFQSAEMYVFTVMENLFTAKYLNLTNGITSI